jgi:hypothetical protein
VLVERRCKTDCEWTDALMGGGTNELTDALLNGQ